MADNQKQSDFISSVRQFVTAYRKVMADAGELSNRWGALYSTILTEEDFANGNEAVIPSGDPESRLTSLDSVMANINTMLSVFDAGIDTNFERVSY